MKITKRQYAARMAEIESKIEALENQIQRLNEQRRDLNAEWDRRHWTQADYTSAGLASSNVD